MKLDQGSKMQPDWITTTLGLALAIAWTAVGYWAGDWWFQSRHGLRKERRRAKK